MHPAHFRIASVSQFAHFPRYDRAIVSCGKFFRMESVLIEDENEEMFEYNVCTCGRISNLTNFWGRTNRKATDGCKIYHFDWLS